jgi:hypothetical protein
VEPCVPLANSMQICLTDVACRMSRCQISEDSHQIATRIAEKLRDVKFSCQIAILAPADTAVLWRDRVVVILAFSLLTALAWSYLLWLSADMAMGGMDMGDFRMIPSSMDSWCRHTRRGKRWSSHSYLSCGP